MHFNLLVISLATIKEGITHTSVNLTQIKIKRLRKRNNMTVMGQKIHTSRIELCEGHNRKPVPRDINSITYKRVLNWGPTLFFRNTLIYL